MIFALDYDRTYNASPELWDEFIMNAQHAGHEVVIATVRHPETDNILELDGFDFENDYIRPVQVIYTNGVAKKWSLKMQFKIEPDVWIDDKPEAILENSKATWEILDAWRANGRV